MEPTESSPSIPPGPYAGPHARPAFVRLLRSAIVGIATGALISRFFDPSVAILAGWDAGGLYLLGAAWWTIAHATPKDTCIRAAAEDPGRHVLFGIILLASSVSMFSNAVLIRYARTLPPGAQTIMILLCLGAAALAWALTHTSYAFRYAHLYYRVGTGAGSGLEFPGECAPCDFDFAYFAFTLGMCFQTSDVVITSRSIRRAVLGHTILSFAFNTVIVALALNLVFGLVQ